MLDRQTGMIISLATGNGAPAGPAFANRTTRTLTWGIRPHSTTCCILKFQAVNSDNTISGSTGSPWVSCPPRPARILTLRTPRWTRFPITNLGVSWVSTDANTGALLTGRRRRRPAHERPVARRLGDAATPVSHPVFRRGDQYVALDKATGTDADIQTLSLPAETPLTPAPTPITTADPERMPAWSPGGLQLGFVRTTADRRMLGSST